MQGWADALTDGAVRRKVGSATYQRGRAYARGGRVEDVSTSQSGMITATVHGSRSAPYRTVLILKADPASGSTHVAVTHCSCPVGVNCKHAAAVMIVARESLPRKAGRRRPSWEVTVAALLDSAGASDQSAGSKPLALQFDVSARPGNSRRAADAGSGRRVSVRPLTRGASGRWVKTGASWHDLQYTYGPGRWVESHLNVVRQLLAAHDAAQRTFYGYRPTSALNLGDFGPGVWRLLEQAQDVGVEFVVGTSGGGSVRLAATASIGLDLTGGSPSRGATLSPNLTIDGTRLQDGVVITLGSPPHGVARLDDGLLLAPLDRTPSQPVVELLRRGEPVDIPAGDLDRFRSDYYPALRQQITVGSSDHSVELPRIEPPHLVLVVRPESHDSLLVEWAFAYPLGSRQRRTRIAGETDPYPARDSEAERRLLAELRVPDDTVTLLYSDAAGGRRLLPSQRLRGIDAVTLVERVLPSLREQGVEVEVLDELPNYRPAESAPVISIAATESEGDIDWFDLHVTVSVDGHDVALATVLAALTAGESHLILPDGIYLRLDLPEVEQLSRLVDEARALRDNDDDAIRVSTYQVGMWEELQRLGVVDVDSERWRRAVGGLLRLDKAPSAPVPQGLKAELRPYQNDGYQWLAFLREYELGGILADDMGLGKTLQTLAMICRAVEDGQASAPFLVVAPTSVVAIWAHEAARFTPGLRVAVVSETKARRGSTLEELAADADVVVTSYTLLRLEDDEYVELPWSGMILDEAQLVKNYRAKSYRSVRTVPAPFKLALTGTPLENTLMDLWSLLSIVAPGLFPDPKRFGEHFRKPIERGTDPDRLTTLRQRIRPLVRRRTKEQVAAELPPKQEQVLEIALSPRHRKIYDTHLQRERQRILGLLDDVDKNRIAIFRSLTRLRQLSLHPVLVDGKHANVSAGKIDVLTDHLAEAVGEHHRALVFSQFTGFLRLVRNRLDAENIPYAYLDGRTRRRQERIDTFKRGDVPVFLISLKAGGFGLNLAEADYCFVLDPWWNPATEAQAVDRAHRIGQDKTVMVYRLVAEDTIEQKVMELKDRKQALFDRVMDDDALMSAPLTVAEIRGLVGLA